jgi:peroxidase
MVQDFIPNHNDIISLLLSCFQSIGIAIEGTNALLGIELLDFQFDV